MTLRAINQNLLPILHALLRERNVTRAAQKVGLSQPAVSKALIQLRAVLGDELLVRSGRSLVLTRRGEELLGPVSAICADMERLWRAETFDPAVSQREFVIAGTDYCAMLMVPALNRILSQTAPGIAMRFIDLFPHQIMEERTDVDFAMVPKSVVPHQLIDAGGVLPLFVDEFVAVIAKGHAHGGRDAVSSAPSIAYGNDSPLIPREIKTTAPFGLPGKRPLATVQQFLTMPLLALLTGTRTVVPRRLLELIMPIIPLQVLEDVAPLGRVEMVLAWHRRRDGDADHRWFRSLVAQHMCDDRFA